MADHSSNINAVAPVKKAVDAIKKNADSVLRYPDHRNRKLTSLVSNYFNVPIQNISVGVGSTQLLFDIPKLLPYKRAVIVVPTFWEYKVLNERNKKPVKKIFLTEEEGFKLDYALLEKNIKPGDAVFICNVNNPTSTIYQKKRLLKLMRDNPKTQFIVDETYLLFRGDYEKQTFSKEAKKTKNIHVIASLSKFFALPGIRLGVIISNKETIDSYVSEVQVPYSVQPLAYVAAEPLLEDALFSKKNREFHDRQREDFYNKAQKKLKGRLKLFEPAGPFIFCRILTGQKSPEIVRLLSQMDILIRGGHELSDVGDQWLRFSIRTKKENSMLLGGLDEVLSHQS